MSHAPLVSGIALVVALAAAPTVSAVTQIKLATRNAVDVCQGSLPSYEGALRKRPLAIANEGTSGAFLSCSLSTLEGESVIPAVGAMFTNRGTASATVNCTLVSGTALPEVPASYFNGSVAIAAGASSPISWSAASGTSYSLANLNCTLPPGVEINFIQNSYRFDVGQ